MKSLNAILLLVLLAMLLVSCERRQEAVEHADVTSEKTSDEKVEVVTPVVDVEIDSEISLYPEETPRPPEPIEETLREYSFAEKLAQAALGRTTKNITYDGRYLKIAYPMGDVPDSIGVCTDVVIRSYRELGIDLQELLHKDIRKHFKRYPNQERWGLSKPDPNIDHRRVPNLRVFFSRHGESLPISSEAKDYLPGDLVTWKLSDKMVHIGIVAEQKSEEDPQRHFIIHNIGRGPELGDILFDYEITGHYRYQPE